MYHTFDKNEQNSARGNVPAKAFIEKFNTLKAQWAHSADVKGYSQSGRLIYHIFTKPTDPINIAIVSDNKEYIEKNLKNYSQDKLQEILMLSCLCGSQSVGNFLIQRLNIVFKDEKFSYILNYISASTNREWIFEIAKAIKEKGGNMPDDVYFFCNDSLLREEIKQIFTENEGKKLNFF